MRIQKRTRYRKPLKNIRLLHSTKELMKILLSEVFGDTRTDHTQTYTSTHAQSDTDVSMHT